MDEAMLVVASAPDAVSEDVQAEMQRARVSLLTMIKAVEEPSLG